MPETLRFANAHDRPWVHIEGSQLKGLCVAATGAREAELWEATMSPGTRTPPHFHDAEEIIYLLDGELEVIIDGDRGLARAGDVVVVPARSVHQLACETRAYRGVVALGRVGAATFLPDGTLLPTPWQD